MALVALLMVAPTALGQGGLPTSPTPQQGDPFGEPIPKPDLIPGNYRLNATDETKPVEICGEVFNVRGDQRTQHPPFDVVLHLDGFEEAVERVHATLTSGEGERLCWTVRLDAGWHRFHWVVDAQDEVEEAEEGNNVAPQRSFYVRPTPQPDLVIRFFDVYPRMGEDHRPQVFRALVWNVGDAPAPESFVDFDDDTGSLGRTRLPALGAGESAEAMVVTRPALRPSGAFVARVTVDATQVVAERNESNNEDLVAYEIEEHPLPNLIVRNMTIEGPLKAHANHDLNVTIENVGDRDMPAYELTQLRVFDGDEPIANETRPPLRIGETITVRVVLRTFAGEHLIRVMVDPDNRIAERDETDNAEQIRLDIRESTIDPEVPNLVMERVDAAPNDPRPGETVTLMALVHNPSNARINETLVRFTINGDELGVVVAPALEPGHYASVTLSWPANVEGTYTIRAAADSGDDVAESNEDDNLVARTFVVIDPPPPPPPPEVEDNTTTPTTPTTPTPTTPTPTTPPPAANNGTKLTIGEVTVTTRAVPGGVKGIAVASLRNPSFEPIGGMTVNFKVDGKSVKRVLVDGLGGAATAPVSSGDLDLPAGPHNVEVEVTMLGDSAPAAVASKAYDMAAGQSGVPGPGALVVALALGVVALAARQWQARRR